VLGDRSAHLPLRVVDDIGEDLDKAVQNGLGAVRFVDLGAVLQLQVVLADGQLQVIGRHVERDGNALANHAGEPQRFTIRAVHAGMHDEHRLIKRRAGRIRTCRHHVGQPLERHVLMCHRAKHHITHVVEHITKCRPARQVEPERHRIREPADNTQPF
jgi:hypothetical protein